MKQVHEKMMYVMSYKTFQILTCMIAFVAGFFVFLNNRIYRVDEQKLNEVIEKLETKNCPSLLLKQNNQYKLMSNDVSNTIMTFNTLQQYEEYMNEQNKLGKACPILYAQEENGIQGHDTYAIHSSPSDIEGGAQRLLINAPTPTNKIPLPFTMKDNNYPGFDPHGLYVGKFTDLDRVHESSATKHTFSEILWIQIGVVFNIRMNP